MSGLTAEQAAQLKYWQESNGRAFAANAVGSVAASDVGQERVGDYRLKTQEPNEAR